MNKLVQDEFLKYPVKFDVSFDEFPELNSIKSDVKLNNKFIDIENQISSAKTLLDKIPEHKFSYLSRTVDLYHKLKSIIKTHYNILISTNASLKMYEMCIQMKLFDKGNDIKCFCNAELPGAFIVAINHFIKTNMPDSKFEWRASSYMPDAAKEKQGANSTILEDKYKIYENNKSNWLFGDEYKDYEEGKLKDIKGKKQPYTAITGDLMDTNQVIRLADLVHKIFITGATLYTSDAGIDVSDDYNKQEEKTILLNYGQCLCGILSLGIGGNFVIKMYTFLTEFNRSLIIVLSSLFKEFYITKPATSRPANSEIYLIGIHFKGITRRLADNLLDLHNSFDYHNLKPLLDLNKYKAMDLYLYDIAKTMGEQQIKFLKEMYELSKIPEHNLKKLIYPIAEKTQSKWLKLNPIKKIENIDQIDRNPLGIQSSNIPNHLIMAHSSDKSVRIIIKRTSGGLLVDVEVLKLIFEKLTKNLEIINLESLNLKDKKTVDIQICIEHIAPKEYRAINNYLLVNQEFLYDWDLISLKDKSIIPLTKTRYAEKLLDSLNIKNIYVSFTSPRPINLVNEIEKKNQLSNKLIIHPAGASWLHGTEEVLNSWISNDGFELDTLLFIIKSRSIVGSNLVFDIWDKLIPKTFVEYNGLKVEQYKNIIWYDKFIETNLFTKLLYEADIHLCPSITEGFGHSINQARAMKKTIITTNAPPMNEFIGCIFVDIDDTKTSTIKQTIPPTKYYTDEISNLPIYRVDQKQLMAKIKYSLDPKNNETLEELRNKAYKSYIEDKEFNEKAILGLSF